MTTTPRAVMCVLGAAAAAWALKLVWVQGTRGLALDVQPVGRAVLQALRQGRRARVREALRGDAWVARLVRAALDAADHGEDVGLAMALASRELRGEVHQALRSLRLLARASTFVGALAAIWEYAHPPRAELGLAGLVAGTTEAVAQQRAVEDLAIGLGFAAIALAARATLRARAQPALVQCDKLRERLENLFDADPAAAGPKGGPAR